ncbi:MAG TPA: polysaccharide deacetylase family protein [Streptosporangiaceae bacterium]|nr:polysaccharide deacetylase family protein [Streptosporangiaceae bacterium]
MLPKPSIESARQRQPIVLMYHSVAPHDEDPYQVTVSPHQFAQQMRWLDRRGLRGVSVAELLDAQSRQCDAGLIGLSFDDGYDDLIRCALPVLQRHGFSATAFVIAGRLGGSNDWDRLGPRKPLMTAAQVRAAAEAGIEIGSHGLRHVSLSQTTGRALSRELQLSRTILQDITNSAISGLCYPYGHFCSRVVDAAQAAGYDYACATTASGLAGRYRMPRVYVGDADGPARLRAKLLRQRLTSTNVPAARTASDGLRRTA